MSGRAKHGDEARVPVGGRRPARGWRETFLGVTHVNAGAQVLAGVTLLAIAIPEQLATSRLAGVPAYTAMIAFIVATLVFVVAGSNPIMSVGADSTIAPLFAAVLLRLAPMSSTLYLELVAMTAVITGLVVMAVGLLRLGWIADFLSLPIVTGFLCGIGVIIIVHQLPSALGVPSGGTTRRPAPRLAVAPVRAREWVVDRPRPRHARRLGRGREAERRLPWALGGGRGRDRADRSRSRSRRTASTNSAR